MAAEVRAHIRSNVIGYVALFVALNGTAFSALRIDSGEVVNNSLKSVDLKNRKGVKNADVVPNSLTGNAINESTLFNDNSLTGADIDESMLSEVRSATNATNADLLDNLDSADFLRSNASAGGDLTGNYPNPLIANNTVSSAQVANGTLRLEDVTALELPLVHDLSSTAADTCQLVMFVNQPAVDIGDRPVLIPPNALPSGLVASPRQVASDQQINVAICNVTNAPIDPPQLTYNVLIFRP